MLRTIVCLTTALAFALHMGMGCCSHHAHADDDHACQHHHAPADHDSHELANSGHHHSHAHHDHANTEESSETPTHDSCPHGRCQGGKCVFVSINKVDLSQLTNVSLPVISLNELLVMLSANTLAQECDSGGPPELPIRLHLLHQVMLI
jgi:hypothetical protein